MNARVMDNQTEELTTESRTIRHAVLDGVRLLCGADIQSARLDAEVLLGHALNVGKAEIYLNADSALSIEDEGRFRELLMRRAKREPVAYLTGRKEFWSLDFDVTPDVLIPRPETELLVELVIQRATETSRKVPLRILDIGTGSGAIAVSLAKELPEAQIWAVDLSAAALNIAGINSRQHGVASRIRFLLGDLFNPITEPAAIFDVIVANPPYIRSGELADLAPEIRDWEPMIALDGGADGLAAYRRIVDEAGNYLAPGGHILLEIGDDMGKAVADLFGHTGGYETPSIYRDYAGKDRIIAAAKISSRDHQGVRRG
jgi:release factor glutamine methyltransferase